MCAKDCKLKMEVRCTLLKLLLFQILVTWCGAKHVTIDDVPRPRLRVEAAEQDVQDSIRNLIHTGIYSHRHLDPAQVQVAHPVKVTRDGALVSHTLQHAHEHGQARARRDLHEVEHLQPHSLHYNLTVDGKHLRLDLRPSVTFMTPAMIVERHGAGRRTRQHPQREATACHYTGNVRGQPNSRVALSACDGLAGLLLTEHGEYWIEPSNQLPADSSEKRAHVIFKRSAVDKVAAFHRAKRAVDSNTDINNSGNEIKYDKSTQRYSRRKGNGRGHRESKEERDRRRREFLEKRRKDLAAMRRNPVEYRRQHPNLRMEERRMHSYSKSSSLEGSISQEQKSIELQKKNDKTFERRLRRLMKRRKRNRSKNCATKQPPYQWKEKNKRLYDKEDLKKSKNGKHHRRNNHHYDISHHKENNNSSRRSTRSVSRPRHVEVLLVADRSMTEFHKQEGLETYLLTIMNMVSTLYMDPSIGNYIKVVVVKIILVEEIHAAEELEVTTNADRTLASFCRWQQQLNPEDDTNPHHHDVAILVTRTDICSQDYTPCSTLGVAHVAGMCKPDRSCSLNEDNGIMLAHTITHELGHNFGLYHDTEKIGCHPREGTTLHIMTPIFDSDTAQVAWSRCSKRDVTNFLDAGLGECLSDKPSQEEYVYPEDPAGVTFNAASQCHLEFGAEAVVCAKPTELCRHLWCLVNNICISTLRAAAPGTTCGVDMWCQNQTCVAKTPSPSPRNGGWGPWSDWSECSRTCGAGVSTQSRECNNPEPYHNGNYCIGDRSRYRICNTDPCPITEPSFREVQCSKHNNMTYDKETVAEWIPYIDQDKPCDLLCVPRDGNETDMLGGFVADGTPCRQTEGSRDMCIAGICYKVGCDWIVNSEAEEDACGVCGGDGSACKTVQGIYNKGTTRQSGYSEVAVIPAGSRNVKIKEKVSPGNYISIASAKSKKMYINGARNATLLEYLVAGAPAIYERDRDWEKVRITGPITEDIKVYQRIFRGRHRNPGVSYQYTVDREQLEDQYSYRLSNWSPCSATCGIGHARRYLECIDSHRRVVEQSRCYHIESPRQNVLMKRCRQPACPAPPAPPAHAAYAPRAPRPAHDYTHWWVGAWNPCSKLCHMPGEQVTKQRNVYCVDKPSHKVVEDLKCDLSSKPITSISCADVPAC